MGRGRAFEVILGSADYDADLAGRIAKFPPKVLRTAKQRINQVTLPDIAEVRTDALWFQKFARSPELKARVAAALERGFNTDPAIEKDLGRFLADLPSS
jgi:enoyl-CoA hydratase/carnithine racemase